MKKIIYIIILFSFSRQVLGQTNFVSNPSFEIYSSCPTGPNQLPKAIGWTAPPNNDAEYLHACSTNTYYGVPIQAGNYQPARTGNAFVGFIVYNWAGQNYREYAQSQLTSTLTFNQNYLIEFFVNRPDGLYGGKYAINNIALSFQSSFTATNSTATNNNVLYYPMHIYKFGNPIINDTLNWVKISGVYKANGNENYIVIGNFKNDSQTDTLNTFQGTYPGAVFFLDDVSVVNITSRQWQYRDTVVNLGDSVLIGPAITGLNVNWYDMSMSFIKNAPGIYVKPTINTSYIAQETFNSIIYTDTVNVTVLSGAGINNLSLHPSELRISPNPNSGLVNIDISNKEFVLNQSVIKIYDVLFREVKEISLQSKKQTLNIQDLNDGIYYLQLHQDKNIILTKKIIKQ